MLLRRVIEHVRGQNWTAITFDFLIVVVGVYLGIQAQSWNVERENRIIERQYLISLYDQLSQLIERNEDRVVSGEERLAALIEVGEYFEGVNDEIELGLRHCRAIGSSHI